MSLRSNGISVNTIDDVSGMQTIDSVATSSSIALQHRSPSSDSSIECISLIDDESDSENHTISTETGLNGNDVSTTRDFES